jgi:hypothetical protein
MLGHLRLISLIVGTYFVHFLDSTTPRPDREKKFLKIKK